jgi:hypothetical protein
VRAALAAWRRMTTGRGPIIRSERGVAMTPVSIVNWFAIAYRAVGLEGCSWHSGRRTFITRAARPTQYGPEPTAQELPRDRDELAPGHLVIARETLKSGWWEAVVIERNDRHTALS